MLNEASSAPATVPVASRGKDEKGDHANVDVRCISFSFMVRFKSVVKDDVDTSTRFGHSISKSGGSDV